MNLGGSQAGGGTNTAARHPGNARLALILPGVGAVSGSTSASSTAALAHSAIL